MHEDAERLEACWLPCLHGIMIACQLCSTEEQKKWSFFHNMQKHAPWAPCRAHLSEAPDEPHRRLAAAGLLADNMVFSDPFVTVNRAASWRDYQEQLRAAGEEPINGFCRHASA